MVTLETFLQPYRDDLVQVEEEIRRHLHTEIPFIAELSTHILDSGGKRLRPVLALVAAKIVTASSAPCEAQRLHRAAAALELMHTATLLHDDVVDESDLRRGKSSARARWGNAPSVLVGDFLLATAFRELTLLGNLAILNTISKTTTLMAQGELLQLLHSLENTTPEAYLKIVIHKTACLFAASAQIGALCGEGTEDEQDALYQFGHHLGIAFQLVDDALDYDPERGRIGKPLGLDWRERKATMPLTRLLEVVSEPVRRDLLKRLQSPETNQAETSEADLSHAVALIQEHGVLEYTRAQAADHVARGVAFLERLPRSNGVAQLRELAGYVVARRH